MSAIYDLIRLNLYFSSFSMSNNGDSAWSKSIIFSGLYLIICLHNSDPIDPAAPETRIILLVISVLILFISNVR